MKLVNEFNNSKYEHLKQHTEAYSPIEKPTLVKPTTSSSGRGRSGSGRAARVIATPNNTKTNNTNVFPIGLTTKPFSKFSKYFG